MHLKIVEFYELYHLIESRNIDIFESINVYGSKRKIESKVKKKYRIPSRNSFTFLQSETLLVNKMQWMIIIPKWQLYFSDKTFQHFKNRIYIWLILESIHKEEKRIWNTIILIVSPNQSSVHKVLLIRIFHCFFMKRFFRSL